MQEVTFTVWTIESLLYREQCQVFLAHTCIFLLLIWSL